MDDGTSNLLDVFGVREYHKGGDIRESLPHHPLHMVDVALVLGDRVLNVLVVLSFLLLGIPPLFAWASMDDAFVGFDLDGEESAWANQYGVDFGGIAFIVLESDVFIDISAAFFGDLGQHLEDGVLPKKIPFAYCLEEIVCCARTASPYAATASSTLLGRPCGNARKAILLARSRQGLHDNRRRRRTR